MSRNYAEITTPLDEALASAAAKERPVSWRARLRHPFAPRIPPIRSFIRKHQLWPAVEFAYNEVLREFGSARVEMHVSQFDVRFPHMFLDLTAPVNDLDFSFVIEFEDALSERIRQRHGPEVGVRLIVTVHSDPDYLPLFDGLPPVPASLLT